MRIRAIILLATILLAIIALAAVLFLPRPDLPTLPWVEIVGVAGFLLALRFVMATSDHVRRLLYLWLVFMSGAGLILLATNTGWAGTFALLSAPIAGFVLLTYFSEVYNRRAGGVLFLITLLVYIAGLAVFAFYTYALAGLLLYGLALAGITLVASWNLIQHLRGATSRIDTSDTSQLFLSIGLSIALAVGLLIITGSFAQNDNPIIGLLQPFVVIAVGIVALSLLRDRLSVLADNEAPGVFAPLDALHYLILPFLAGWAILTVLQLNLTLLNVYIIQILAMALLALIGDLLRHGMYHPTSEAARDVPVDTRLRDPLILLMWAALIGYAVLRYGQGTCWEMLAALVVCFFPATIMIVILLLRDTLTQPLPEAARRDYTFWGRFRASYRYNDPLERQLAEYADREQPESITEIIAAIPTTISLLRALGWTAVYVFSLYALVQAGTGRSDGAELTGLALALPVLCWWLVQHANLTRRMAYLHEFDETVTILRDQIRLGTSLLLTIEALARQAPPLFRNAFRQVLISVQIGIPLADAMWQCIGNKRIPELSYLSDTILMPQTINANATQNLPPSLTRLKDLHHLRFPATYSLSLLTLLPHLIVLLASLFAIALIPVQLASFALADTFSHLSGWPSGVIGLGVGGIVIGCIQSARYERILVHTALRYRVTALWLTELALYLLGAIGLLALWLSNWTYDGKADVLALAAGVLATTISLRLITRLIGLGLARPSWQTPTLERSLQLGATVIRLLIGSYLIAILVTELITESNMVVPWLVKGGFVLLVLTGVFLVMALISGIPHWLFGYLSSLPHVMEWGCAGFILLLAGIGLMAVGLGGSRHMLIVQLALIMITVSVLWLLPPIPTAIKLVVVLALWLELSVALIWQYVDLVEGTTTLNRIMTLIILLPILAAWYWSWLRQSAFALHNPADFSPRTTAISYELFHLQRLEAGILNRSMMILTLLLIAIGHDYPLADYLWPLVLLDSLFWAFTWLVLPLTRAALSRRVLIQDLADNLTLMTSVIENQGVDQALEVVAKVTQRRTLFGREFARVLYEIQLGKTREDAYRDLAIRHNFPALHTVVALFNQQHQELRQQVGILDELTQRMQRQASAQDARLAAEFAPSLLLVVSLAIIPALTLWLTGIGLI